MSDEDLELLKAVRDWRPPTTLHPIAMQAWHLYEKSGNKLPPEALQAVRERLLNGYGSDGEDLKGLAEALEGLARFMILVTEQHKDKETGTHVADLMREYTHLFEPFWQRVGEALANVGSDARSSFLDFLDGEGAALKNAPVYGQTPPKGTVPLRSLAPPARPPPWAGKKPGKTK